MWSEASRLCSVYRHGKDEDSTLTTSSHISFVVLPMSVSGGWSAEPHQPHHSNPTIGVSKPFLLSPTTSRKMRIQCGILFTFHPPKIRRHQTAVYLKSGIREQGKAFSCFDDRYKRFRVPRTRAFVNGAPRRFVSARSAH